MWVSQVTTEDALLPTVAAVNNLGNTTEPNYRAGVFVKNDDGYELTPESSKFLPASLAGAATVLNQVATGQKFRRLEEIFSLTSDRSLREHFESGCEKRAQVVERLPSLEDFSLGDVIVFRDELILLKDKDHELRSFWRLIPKNGSTLSDAELEVLEKELGLREKVPSMESFAILITSGNLSNSRHAFDTIKAKIDDPDTTKLKKFLIPDTAVELHLRISKGNRLWVALPKNHVKLSKKERVAVEKHLGLTIKKTFNDNPSNRVSKDDIICSGENANKYFRGGSDHIHRKTVRKLPNIDDHQTNKFTPAAKDYRDLEFEIKIDEDDEAVWTIHRNKYIRAGEYLDLIRKNKVIAMSKDAVVLYGEYAKGFWVEAESDINGFNKLIEEKIVDPRLLDDEFILVESEDKSESCKVYLGEINGEYFLWVERDKYPLIAEILDLQPTDRSLRRLSRADQKFRATPVFISVNDIKTDGRDDGTNNAGLQGLRRSDRIY